MKNEIKKNHHYVWRHYLKAWSINNNLFYMSLKGNIANDSILGIACERNFYKVSFFNANDLKVARHYAGLSDKDLSKLHNNLIDNVLKIQNMFYMGYRFVSDISSLKKQETLILNNFLEDYLAVIENDNVSFINQIRTGNMSVFDKNETRWKFCYYLGYQIARTKKMKQLLQSSTNFIDGDETLIEFINKFHNKHWWFMCFYYGTNLARDLSLNPNYKFKLLNNCTDEPFITSDQPIVNINPLGHLSDDLDYYYPISENKALLIYSSPKLNLPNDILDKNTVFNLNIEICKGAANSIYSSSSEMIKKYRKYFNLRKFRWYML